MLDNACRVVEVKVSVACRVEKERRQSTQEDKEVTHGEKTSIEVKAQEGIVVPCCRWVTARNKQAVIASPDVSMKFSGPNQTLNEIL